MQDIRTIVWKERRTIFRDKTAMVRLVSILISPAALCAYVAWDSGTVWLETHIALLAAVLAPALAAVVTVPDVIAGERERKTLQTLLSSRISSRAILYGKMVIPAALALGTWLGIMLVGAILANFRVPSETVLVYDASVLLANTAFFLLTTVFSIGLGALVSLHAASVQGALQTLVMGVLSLPLLGGAIWLLLPRAASRWLARVEADTAVNIAIGVLVAASVLIHVLLLKRFKRWTVGR